MAADKKNSRRSASASSKKRNKSNTGRHNLGVRMASLVKEEWVGFLLSLVLLLVILLATIASVSYLWHNYWWKGGSAQCLRYPRSFYWRRISRRIPRVRQLCSAFLCRIFGTQDDESGSAR